MPLKAISLHDNYTITDAEICLFAGILIAKKDTIAEISTPFNMTHVGWNVFLAALHTPMPNFTYLSLETSNLSDDIRIAFADCLKNQASFKRLNLYRLSGLDDTVTDVGYKALQPWTN
jgi:hypothetical protein